MIIKICISENTFTTETSFLVPTNQTYPRYVVICSRGVEIVAIKRVNDQRTHQAIYIRL